MLLFFLGLVLGCLTGSIVFLLWAYHSELERKATIVIRPSPLVYLDFETVEKLLYLRGENVTCRRRLGAEDDANLRFSASSDAVEMLVEKYERGVKVLDGADAFVTIDFNTRVVRILDATGTLLASVDSQHFELVRHEASGAHNLLQNLPSALHRLPELIVGSLIPLAHYLSGVENSRRLNEANAKLAQSHGRDLDVMDQKLIFGI